jgi:hypothetical protein
MGRATPEKVIDPQLVESACAVYNDIYTSLIDGGWRLDSNATSPGYWWLHTDHAGSFSMSAAYRRHVLTTDSSSVERAK